MIDSAKVTRPNRARGSEGERERESLGQVDASESSLGLLDLLAAGGEFRGKPDDLLRSARGREEKFAFCFTYRQSGDLES